MTRPTIFARPVSAALKGVILAGLALTALLAPLATTDARANAAGGASGLPLPRYVSLKSEKVYMRVGPGREYRIEWMYLKRGLPMEVIQEYDTWRKVRDSEGNEGWILHSLLSGDRTAIIAPWEKGGEYVAMRKAPSGTGDLVARVEPGVVATVAACRNGWCELRARGARGYVEQNRIWGVYPDESFDK